MFCSILLFCSLGFAETKTLALQICLDREGYSCNTIDGVWGEKSKHALNYYSSSRGIQKPFSTPEKAFDTLFPNSENLFKIEVVTEKDLASLVSIPSTPAEKAKLERLGYESIKEMFAERGHLSTRALERMNVGVDWENIKPGLKLVIPSFPSIKEHLSSWPRRANSEKFPIASRIEISLSLFHIRVYGEKGNLIALFPCSIAKNKSKRPSQGTLKVTTIIANPNYTYTPDYTAPGQKIRRHILPEGPNTPIGVAWIGLNLPGYGIHGTPSPQTVGCAESHGCFRLSNWNAARLYSMCPVGTSVIILQ
jgi:lipoprotein-anchoring transpeptidase ErfK/SrfK